MLQQVMSTYFERWKFRHPQPDDFFAVVNEVTGQDMTWFFDQVYRSSNVFDYGVQEFTSRRRRPQRHERGGPAKTVSTVVVAGASARRLSRWTSSRRSATASR